MLCSGESTGSSEATRRRASSRRKGVMAARPSAERARMEMDGDVVGSSGREYDGGSGSARRYRLSREPSEFCSSRCALTLRLQ